MSFTISTAGIPRLNSYLDAEVYYNKAAADPWQTGGEDFPFPDKRHRKYGVSKAHDGSIAFRYHDTKVVTWHPDGSCTLRPWNSRSTGAFADVPLPNHAFTMGDCSRLVIGGWTDGRVYALSSRPVLIRGVNDPIDTGAVFAKEKIDRKKAKAALARTRYEEYRNWHRVMRAMLDPATPATGYMSQHQIFEALSDETRWHALMLCFNNADHPDKVRDIIYRQNWEVFYEERVESLTMSQARSGKWHPVPA